MSSFESRKGEMSCSPEELFYFFTDMRNFKRFIPEGTVSGWEASIDNCSFSVPKVGQVNVRLDTKTPFSLVSFRGDALKNNDFELILHIEKKEENITGIRINLNADLNPIMKLVASKPIEQFMKMIVDRMENLNCREELMK